MLSLVIVCSHIFKAQSFQIHRNENVRLRKLCAGQHVDILQGWVGTPFPYLSSGMQEPSLLRDEHQALLHPLPRHDATHCFLDVLTSLCGEWSSCVWVQRTIACCWVHCGWELGCTMPCMCGSVRYSPCVQTHDWREERKNNSDYFFFLFSFYLFFLMLRQVTYALHLAICWCRHL